MSELRESVLEVVQTYGLEDREQPFTLTSGEGSHDYMDGKRALAQGRHLRLACEAIIALAAQVGADFDAVGGLTLGADAFATGVALVADKKWVVAASR